MDDSLKRKKREEDIKMISLLLFGATFLIYSSFCIYPDPDVGKSPLELIETHGYPAETHTVVTDDDYILTIYRIPYGKKLRRKKKNRPPVLIVHGIVSSSAEFLNTANKSLGFILADNGYDVWLLNARGTTFSRAHKTLDPDRDGAKFFNFTWHEIGTIDTPNTIDYILSATKQKKLFYIGFSQGATSYAVMGSLRPEYNEKIRFAALLAPSVFYTHADHRVKLLMSPWYSYITRFVLENILNMYEFPGKFRSMLRDSMQTFCGVGEPFHQLCQNMFEIIGFNSTIQIDMTKLAVHLSNYPNSASILQLIHYAQIIIEGRFQWFDDGMSRNPMKRPREYNVSLVDSPVGLFYGRNDFLVPLQDVEKLRNTLPNVVVNYEVPYEKFNHIDFVTGKDVVTLVYNDLLKYMKRF